jgi:peroxiredoxin Q/BCP
MKKLLKSNLIKIWQSKKTTTVLFLMVLFFSTSFTSAQKTKLKVGDRVPYFSLLDQNGNEFDTKDYIGKKSIVLFFYPKDNAPICEAQVCTFRDNYSKFVDAGAIVVGINPGHLTSHKKFATSNNLQFPILADKNNVVQKMFGIPKIFLSKNPKRYTFIIDKYGIIRNVYYKRGTNVNKHVEEALKTIKQEEL